jgi:hypothetical protein
MYFYVVASSPLKTIKDTAGKTIAYSTWSVCRFVDTEAALIEVSWVFREISEMANC